MKMTTWAQFITSNMAVLVGTGFLSVEVLTQRGLLTSWAVSLNAAGWSGSWYRCIARCGVEQRLVS
jgi:hypothetical protein